MKTIKDAIMNCDALDWKKYKVTFDLVEEKRTKRTVEIMARGRGEVTQIMNHKFRTDTQWPTNLEVEEISK